MSPTFSLNAVANFSQPLEMCAILSELLVILPSNIKDFPSAQNRVFVEPKGTYAIEKRRLKYYHKEIHNIRV
jgi:hypothetical protein